MLALFFEQVARDDAFCTRCTSWFQRACTAVGCACPVGHGSIISDQPVALQRFAARTREAVGLVVELKIRPRKKGPWFAVLDPGAVLANIVFVAATSACHRAGVASTSTMTANLLSISAFSSATLKFR
jgi:hypothetical protein